DPGSVARAAGIFFACVADHRDLDSFPTRRSSDLSDAQPIIPSSEAATTPARAARPYVNKEEDRAAAQRVGEKLCIRVVTPFDLRSEEHTSELQSRENLVCRLLLEKKTKGTQPPRD